MKSILAIILVSYTIILLTSCKKEAKFGVEFAGVYDVYEYELNYYSNNRTTPDSTKSNKNMGTINLLFEHPSLEQNYMSFNLVGGRLLGWSKIPANTPITWATTEKNPNILIFSNAPDGDVSLGKISLVSYNVEFLSFGKQKWTYIETNTTGAMIKEEIVYVKKY